LHWSEKKKLHEKKEIEESFVSQKCPKHEKEKLNLFCVKDEVKCCSLCLSDHISHVVVPITQAITLFRSEIQNKNFKEIYSKLETELKQIDKEIMTKKKEISDLEVKKLLKVYHLESVQNISNSIKREEDFDKILEWRSFFEEKIESQFKIYACGDNSHGTIGLGEKIDKINKFTEIQKFQNKKIDLISCGSFSCFIYTSKLFILFILDHKLCAIGDNFRGHLGIGNTQDQKEFTPVDFFSNLEILKISCGSYHTIVQCSS
jgi:hypothetical protein